MSNGSRIFIIENELIVARSTQALLEREGYSVRVISRGSMVLGAVKEEQPDVMLMDIHLEPGFNGIDLARELNLLYEIPIIYITQDGSPEIFRNAVETYPINFISKPFSETDLIRAVSLAIGYNRHKPRERQEVYISTSVQERQKVVLADILYVRALRAYTLIAIAAPEGGKPKELTLAKSSNHVIESLRYASLVQVHRSYFVNIRRISAYRSDKVYIGNEEIPVSRANRAMLEDLLRGAK